MNKVYYMQDIIDAYNEWKKNDYEQNKLEKGIYNVEHRH